MALPTLKYLDGGGTTMYEPAHLVTTSAGTAAAAGTYTPIVSLDGGNATYYAAAVDIAPVATPTAIFLLKGSATKTIRIRRIKVTGMATAYGEMKVKVAKWSADGTVGSATLNAITPGVVDSSNSAATAVPYYISSANYTTEGTQTVLDYGNISFVPLTTAATSSADCPYIFDAGRGGEQAIVLRGVAQFLAIGGDGDAVPSGGVLHLQLCWTEESES